MVSIGFVSWLFWFSAAVIAAQPRYHDNRKSRLAMLDRSLDSRTKNQQVNGTGITTVSVRSIGADHPVASGECRKASPVSLAHLSLGILLSPPNRYCRDARTHGRQPIAAGHSYATRAQNPLFMVWPQLSNQLDHCGLPAQINRAGPYGFKPISNGKSSRTEDLMNTNTYQTGRALSASESIRTRND
jgi:hypothetical protein